MYVQVYTNLVEISSDAIPNDNLLIYTIPVTGEEETIYSIARRHTGSY